MDHFQYLILTGLCAVVAWSFSRRLTTGVELFGYRPVEELVFFLLVPICGILTFEAVRNLTDRRRR